jgi:hypothetical protein
VLKFRLRRAKMSPRSRRPRPMLERVPPMPWISWPFRYYLKRFKDLNVKSIYELIVSH